MTFTGIYRHIMSNNLEALPNTVMGLHAIIEHHGAISHMSCCELEVLLNKAAQAAGATVLGANFHDFGDGVGNTGVLMLAESHISVHTWPECHYAAIDIFVCNESSHTIMDRVEAAIDVLRSADRQGCFHHHVIHRAAPESANSNGQLHTLKTDFIQESK